MSGRCDTCGEVGDVWCGLCMGPHPDDAHRRLRQSEERLAAANATIAALAVENEELRAFVYRTGRGLTNDLDCAARVLPETAEYLIKRSQAILAQPADAAAALAGAVLEAGDVLASDIAELLSGGIEMKPVTDGPVTFEAMLMLLQMLGVHRDAYRRARAALRGDGAVETS